MRNGITRESDFLFVKKLLTEKRSGDNIKKFAAENSRREGRANDRRKSPANGKKNERREEKRY